MALYEMKLWLIEFYTSAGNIKFAWVKASSRTAAIAKLKHEYPLMYEELITITDQERIVPLNTSTGNPPLFVDCERAA